ncbi:RagB/SusD family nutrient uptake outer membrane protein [Sphingobacterium sp. UT-1RO-CII-1]|uniref:RagB/SusD family nutrient uptake outer membrane protein n=1 Tax=Sphingobacterium sp. UT-1RO-CII-1 TaxID=2995225 RepID=UPI00227B64A5|nr:RagB/SusD family nutrient uptake outer membrane protein [Sphingobacterium sp. UT-1RO-CII-1]MCY4779028.1 RagB/SusD family nutrient uptake outer membrane protein [Sphingobacterium sp. UT-1RO-CII-1]
MKIFNFLLLSVALTTVSCSDDFLSLKPTDIIIEEEFFKNTSDAEAALMGVYSTLQKEEAFSNVRDAADIEWSMSGDMYEMDGSANRIELHSLTLPSTNTILRDVYTAAYYGISRANLVIHKVQEMPDGDERDKNVIVSQAKFLRALYYYRLVTYFGGVPLILEPLNASSDLQIPRSNAETIWKSIEDDLISAKTVLPKTWDVNNVGKVTSGACKALLNKAYLWQARYADVISVSKELFDEGIYDLLKDYRTVFLESNENNKEILFSTQFREGTDAEGNNLVKRTAPRGAPAEFTGGAAWSNFVPQKHWVDSHEKDASGKIKDKRYWASIIGPEEAHQDMPAFVMPNDVPAGWSISGYIMTKYWQKPTLNNSGVNAPIIRFAEILLNYAEALNEEGKSADAIDELNKVRERAGLDLLTNNLNKDQVLNAIFKERRMEFIWEPSGGFSDLNRRGRFLDFIKAERPNYKELNVSQKPWLNTTPILFPIPKDAWDRNKALEQNPHYTF